MGWSIIQYRMILHLVETYFIIMNMRFQGKIQLRVQVEEKILHCRIPVIFLQPFVENACFMAS